MEVTEIESPEKTGDSIEQRDDLIEEQQTIMKPVLFQAKEVDKQAYLKLKRYQR